MPSTITLTAFAPENVTQRLKVLLSACLSVPFQYRAKILAGKNASKMTYFMSSGTSVLNFHLPVAYFSNVNAVVIN